MRKVWFLLLAAVAMATALQSCGEDDEILTENPSDIEFALFYLDE